MLLLAWAVLTLSAAESYIQVVSPEVGCSIVDSALSLQAGLLVDMTQPMTSSSTPGEGCEGSGHQKGG
jgi:hypothetical protein